MTVPDVCSLTPNGQLRTASQSYRDSLEYLFVRTTGKWKLGLERMSMLLDALGRPQEQLRAFHVGGTNGKGSVCATLEALLRGRGLRVGVYSSPHLVDFRERIRVDGVSVTEDEVTTWILDRAPLVEELGATFFEATTAMAFEFLARRGVDVAVVEVGLGGRLDATNVVDPLAAGVASIGIDHVEYLGNTREEIAGEKAGIFKLGRPAVIGEPDAGIRDVLARHASDVGASPVLVTGRDFVVSELALEPARIQIERVGARDRHEVGTGFTVTMGDEQARLWTPLAGVHQASNAALAIAMLRAAGIPYSMPLSEAGKALHGVWLPGRFQRDGRYIFDVAHNPDGAAVLAETMRAVGPPRPVTALLSVLGDKDWRGIIEQLAPVVDRFVLTMAPTAPASRAWSPECAAEFAARHGWDTEVVSDFGLALERASEGAGTVLITGSFHTVGDAMMRLQASQLAG